MREDRRYHLHRGGSLKLRMIPRILVEVYRCFGQICFLNLQGRSTIYNYILSRWRHVSVTR